MEFPMPQTTCLYPKWLIPVEPRASVLTDHSLVIIDEKIHAVLPTIEARSRFGYASHVELAEHAIIPGLINLHAHSAMALLRGLADDLALMDWLNHHIWPAEAKHVSDEFVYDGSMLAAAEMLRGGTTTVNDMYFHHEAVARAGIASGMRTVVGCSILEFPTGYAENADGYLTKAMSAIDSFKGEAGICFTLAPHAPYTVSDSTFSRVVGLAEQHELGIHCHIHETKDEIESSLNQYQKRPLQRLHELGVLSSKLVAAHVVHANDEEIALLAQQGVHVAHNPASNLKLASGFARIHAMQNAGVNVGLGTDGAASNNKLDLLGDMRLAALLAKSESGNPSALNAATALEMATLSGAKALGLEYEIGSLLVGKSADIVAIDLSDLETQPLFDPISHLVYATDRNQVSHVWVRGRALLVNRVLTTINAHEIKEKANWWHAKIAAK
jgi:5-methylthioadenosine/S-adenosylhomocysteine deaminase